MNIRPFSCVRPDPEHIAGVLGAELSDEAIRSAIKDKTFTLDISRALYLCAYSDGAHTWTALYACVETEANGEPKGAYQTSANRVVYTTNIAIDVILSAATAAVPLYNLQNGTQQIVVWRISRSEALEALQAAFASIEMPKMDTPYNVTMVELVSDSAMPQLPSGLFAHPAK